MKIYAISDLHLSLGTDKEMDVFGARWEGYHEKIEENWNSNVSEEDWVLVPGDISWATYIKDAKKDFAFLNGLPGKKILLKGNHDYWWSSIRKIKSFLKENEFNSIHLIQNDSIVIDQHVICGSRGWKSSEDAGFTEEDKKIHDRELLRLRLSLDEASKNNCELICLLHFPPFNMRGETNEFVDIMNEYDVKKCLYGHVHQEGAGNIVEGEINGIEFIFVSADYLEFNPKLIVE